MLVCEVDSGVCGYWGCLWCCYLFFGGDFLVCWFVRQTPGSADTRAAFGSIR